MSGISVEKELARLRNGFDRTMAGLPAELGKASGRLLGRIKLDQRRPGHWVDRFSPLTVLYPLMQAEGLGRVGVAQARRAARAHLLLLIYAFVDDRRIDGQIKLSRTDIQFAEGVWSKATALLPGLWAPSGNARKWFAHLRNRYDASQTSGYGSIDANEPSSASGLEPMEQLAADRSSLGAIATLAMAESAGYEARMRRRLTLAFDLLTAGLQWGDDLEDWREDRDAARPNFILRLMDGRARDAPRKRNPSSRYAKRRSEKPSREVVLLGIRRGCELLRKSARAQRRFGCAALASLIEKKAERFERMEEELLGSIQGQILEALGKLGRSERTTNR